MTSWACGACSGENPAGTRFCGFCGVRRDLPTEVAARAEEAGAVDESRLVTSLFADISGFTTLADRVDAETLHEVIEPVIAGLAAVGERYDGFIAKYAGDALLIFFGAPVAHEDDPTRALLVALEMHAALPALVADLPAEAHGLELHIGVNTGRVVAGRFGGEIQSDYSILGDAVILAQRLESVCPSGQTYVGETTMALTADQFAFDPLGELSLKGKVRPVPAWRLVGRRSTPEASTNRARANRLVGRARELAAVDSVLGRLAGGTGGILGLTGEPGVGKSRLLEEVQRQATGRGVRWLQARCVSYGSGLAYWPYTDVIRRSLQLRREDPPEAGLPRLAAALGDRQDALPFLARLLGADDAGSGSVPGALDAMAPSAFRLALHDAVATWLRAVAADGPVVLAIEDLHWADSSSIELTAHLLAGVTDSPLAICVTARVEGSDAVAGLVADAADRGRHLAIGPLDEGSLRALAGEALAGDPPPELVSLLVERTGGNPLFAHEVVRGLVDDGSLERGDADRWHMRRGWDREAVPVTVERVLGARIDRLPATTAQVLQQLAVIGRLVRRTLLVRVLDDVADLDAELTLLLDLGFLDPATDGTEEAVIFHHALVHEVAYERLLRRNRRDLHRRVAEVAEGLYGASDDLLDLLAHHLYLGDAGSRAIGYLRRAGDRARRLFATDQAVRHFARGVELARRVPEAEADLDALLLDLAALQELAGSYEEAAASYDEARARTDDVRAWRGLAASWRKQGRFAEAVRLLDEGLGRARLHDVQAHLLLERADVLVAEARYEEAIATARRGRESPGAAGGVVAAELLLQQARAEEAVGRLEAALGHASTAFGSFEAHGHLHGMAAALRVVGGVELGLGRLAEAVRTLRRGLELAERTGEVEELASCLVNLGQVERELGDLDAAGTSTRRALEQFERIRHTTGRSVSTVNLAELLLEGGDPDAARPVCEAGLDLARSAGIALIVADAHALLSRIALAREDHEEAGRRGEEAGHLYAELGLVEDAAAAFDRAAGAWSAAGDDARAEAARASAPG